MLATYMFHLATPNFCFSLAFCDDTPALSAGLEEPSRGFEKHTLFIDCPLAYFVHAMETMNFCRLHNAMNVMSICSDLGPRYSASYVAL